jgi:hypothetical protein
MPVTAYTNPGWLAWLMGYPDAWMSAAPSATQLSLLLPASSLPRSLKR